MMEQLLSNTYLLPGMLFSVICLISSWILLGRKTTTKVNFPPGPSGLPLIGNLHQIKVTLFLTFHQLSQKYGKIFHFRLGQRHLVVLNSLEHLKTVLSQEKFNGRIQSDFVDTFTKKCGVIFAEGDTWKTHRRLSLHILKDLGFGKSISEDVIHHEAVELCTYLDDKIEKKEAMLETAPVFSSSTMNVISTIVFGERPGYEDQEFMDLLEFIQTITKKTSMLAQIPIIFPTFSFISILLPLLESSKIINKGHNFIFKKMAEHRKHLEENNVTEPRDFVEAYYLAQRQSAEKHGSEVAEKEFSEWQIMRTVFELYLAGLETTATTLCWTTLLLSCHPDVRERMTQEIHSVIGRDKIVCMDDKKHFQYSLAVIDEILRWTSLAPQALFHRAMESGTIGGYDVPEGTLIIPNLYTVHHDPEIWEKPDDFYPQHFLSEDGATYRPRDHLIPFGIGKRVCLGESLARMEIFIFIITLVQRYRFESHFDSKRGESLEKALIGYDGPVRGPGDHKITFKKLQ